MGRAAKVESTLDGKSQPTDDTKAVTSKISFPTSFIVHTDTKWSNHFMIQETEDRPLFAISCNTTVSTEPSLVLYSGPTADAPPLASMKYNSTDTDADITLHITPDASDSPTELRVEYKLSFDGHDAHCFSATADGTEQLRNFKWRRGTSGWQLVMFQESGQEGEIVAEWRLEDRGKKEAIFEFCGTGATGDLGERWALIAVVTGLRVWDKVRRDSPVKTIDRKASLLTMCAVS